MALKTTLVDDIDNTLEGAETQSLSINGEHYEIDLVPANLKKLMADLAPWITAGRKAGHKRKVGVTKPTPSSTSDLNAIRTWWRSKGGTVSDRGRIPRDVIDQFNASHRGNAPAAAPSKPELFSAANA